MSNKPNGLCNLRTSESKHQYYVTHRERIQQRNKAYYVRNRERIRERAKAYYARNKERKLQYQNEYSNQHKEELAIYNKQWRVDNSGHVKEKQKARYVNNSTAIRSKQKEWYGANKETVARMNKQRRAVLSQLKQSIKTTYGCMNPTCRWNGEFEPWQLHFHHIEDKTFNIGTGALRSIPRLVSEITKCTILCANCHSAVTWGSLDPTDFPKCKLDQEGNIVRAV